jgi:hypothetical protein
MKGKILESFSVTAGMFIYDLIVHSDQPIRADFLAFIRALTFKEKTRHGKPSTKGRTLYFDKIHYVGQLNFIVKRNKLKQRQGA